MPPFTLVRLVMQFDSSKSHLIAGNGFVQIAATLKKVPALLFSPRFHCDLHKLLLQAAIKLGGANRTDLRLKNCAEVP